MRTQGIKQIANRMLNEDQRPQAEKRAICELMDAYIAQHKNPVDEGFFYLDLYDREDCKQAWEAAGKPVLTKSNDHRYIMDVYRREYY